MREDVYSSMQRFFLLLNSSEAITVEVRIYCSKCLSGCFVSLVFKLDNVGIYFISSFIIVCLLIVMLCVDR